MRFATLEFLNHNTGYITLSIDAPIAIESLGGEINPKNQKKTTNPTQNLPGYEIKSEDLVALILSFKFYASEEVFGSRGCRVSVPPVLLCGIPEKQPVDLQPLCKSCV